MPDKDGNITIHDVQVACGHICGGCENLRQSLRAAEAEVAELRGFLGRIKDEAYGQKQWAFVVDQACLALSLSGEKGAEEEKCR